MLIISGLFRAAGKGWINSTEHNNVV